MVLKNRALVSTLSKLCFYYCFIDELNHSGSDANGVKSEEAGHSGDVDSNVSKLEEEPDTEPQSEQIDVTRKFLPPKGKRDYVFQMLIGDPARHRL